MPINMSALAGFRGASSWNEDAVANLSGGGIASHGLYEGRLKAAFSKRGQDVKAANNAVRTALLTALGNVTAISRKKYDEMGSAAIKAEVGEMARKLAESIKSAKSFNVEDPEMAEFDAQLTAYWQDALADKMKDGQNYVRHGVFNLFMLVDDSDKYTIQGPKYENRHQAILRLKNVVKISAHRKAVTTVMSQPMRGFMVQNLSSGGTLPNTTHFTGLSMKSMKGGEHLLSVDNTDGTFEEGLVKERNAEVNLRIEGRKATVVVKSHGDIQLNITDAYEWHDIPMGTCNYEARFEFDLSDENEAKLTSVHLGQTIQA